MLSDLKHPQLKKALLLSAELGIGRETKDSREWAKFMGLPEMHSFNVARHIAEVGREINDAFGFDFIDMHFPKWKTSTKFYRAFSVTVEKTLKVR